jgi:hypothetical protein
MDGVEILNMSFDKIWANDCLRMTISDLDEHALGSDFVWRQAKFRALFVKDRLVWCGFPWQAERVDNWLHFYEAKRLHALAPKATLLVRAEEIL